MDDCPVLASPALLAANCRLYALRAQMARPAAVAAVALPDSVGAQPEVGETAVSHPPPLPSLPDIIASLPPHLGWGDERATAVVRRQQKGQSPDAHPQAPASRPQPPISNPQAPTSDLQAPGVRLYPDIGMGMLRQEMAAPGRLWLLLHHLDLFGQGVFRIDSIKEKVTEKHSAFYLCGKRHLRNLLRAGEGVFWTRDSCRVWLRSAGRVAYALGVERLTGRPVALPLSALLEGMGAFRAHLYAAFHSGRLTGTEAEQMGRPIARDTLAGLSGVARTTQRVYEARLKLRPQANYAIGEAVASSNEEERAWQQGQALFTLKDYRGQHGKRGKSYLAWQLPNSYGGRHQQRPKGRQKRINRQLKDLVMKGMPGNEGEAVERQRPERRYFPNGRSAGQARGRNIAKERYWRRQGGGNGRFALWHPLR